MLRDGYYKKNIKIEFIFLTAISEANCLRMENQF